MLANHALGSPLGTGPVFAGVLILMGWFRYPYDTPRYEMI